MTTRIVTALMIVGVALMLLGLAPRPAAAQDGPPSLADLAGLFDDRPPVGARILRLDGPKAVSVDEETAFTASANVDVATLPLKSRWDFGDGTTRHGLATRHRFAAPGTYHVVFTLQNAHGADADTLVVHVQEKREGRVANGQWGSED